MNKLLKATLNIVESRGESLFLDASESYAYTLVARFGNKKFLLKVSQDAERVSSSAVRDIKLIGSCTKTPSALIVSRVKGQVLQRGIVYIRGGAFFMSLSTFIDMLDGKEPVFKLSRGTVTAAVNGKRLRERRIEEGLSLKNLAEKLGVTRETVYRYEREEVEVPAKIAKRLAALFGEDVIHRVKIDEAPRVTPEDLLSRHVGGSTYRLVESHPDAVRVTDDNKAVFISASREKYERAAELASALGAEIERA
ncbi:MAG: helix-turn-helix domain-containing protein [Thermoproteaceae archaeon]|nr:helix-turn-helix domain-containing protein [Thermoproteaceae archaeon]